MSRLVRGVGLQHPALSAFPDRLLRWTCNYSWMEGLEFCVIVLCRTVFWSAAACNSGSPGSRCAIPGSDQRRVEHDL
jgi:hypothetical protein